MDLTEQVAKHFREVFFGGNWTSSNLKDQLADVSWQEAITQVYELNTIAMLTYHISYYVSGVLHVLRGGELEIRDKYSYDLPPIHKQEDWEALLSKMWGDVELFAEEVEKIPDNRLGEYFTDEKYGLYFRNLIGIIEHTHYHLGQIVVIKKVLRNKR